MSKRRVKRSLRTLSLVYSLSLSRSWSCISLPFLFSSSRSRSKPAHWINIQGKRVRRTCDFALQKTELAVGYGMLIIVHIVYVRRDIPSRTTFSTCFCSWAARSLTLLRTACWNALYAVYVSWYRQGLGGFVQLLVTLVLPESHRPAERQGQGKRSKVHLTSHRSRGW